MKKAIYLCFTVLILGACSQEPSEEEKNKIGGAFFESSDSRGNAFRAAEEEEGPQYQTPTIEVLKGKAQKYPARYPMKRYPGSKVAMVDVRPNRSPGVMNMVMLTTADKSPRVSGFYQKQLMQENWKKVSEYRNSIYESSTWVKGDLECEVRVSPDLVHEGSEKKYVQLFYGKRWIPPGS